MIFDKLHCGKSVQIRSFFWSVFFRIQSECGKIRTRKIPYLDTFHIVLLAYKYKYFHTTYIFETKNEANLQKVSRKFSYVILTLFSKMTLNITITITISCNARKSKSWKTKIEKDLQEFFNNFNDKIYREFTSRNLSKIHF